MMAATTETLRKTMSRTMSPERLDAVRRVKTRRTFFVLWIQFSMLTLKIVIQRRPCRRLSFLSW
jgi:hypothetical protein